LVEEPLNTDDFDSDSHWLIKDEGSTILINTWYGASPGFDGLHTCTLKTLYRSFRAIAENLNIDIPPLGDWALPDVGVPSMVPVPEVENQLLSSGELYLLICNNSPLSAQTDPINWEAVTSQLLKALPESSVLLTNSIKGFNSPRVVLAEDLFGGPKNLVELSNFSTKMHSIIGSSSGPYTYSMTHTTLMNPRMKFICFCGPKSLAHWAGKVARATTVWSRSTKTGEVLHDIIRGLKKQ
jgi:hypothetical protein